MTDRVRQLAESLYSEMLMLPEDQFVARFLALTDWVVGRLPDMRTHTLTTFCQVLSDESLVPDHPFIREQAARVLGAARAEMANRLEVM